MKKITIIFFSAALAVGFAACNDQNDSVQRAKDVNEQRDDQNVNAVDANDADFAVKAANGGMSEVQFGNLAKEMAVSQDVKDLADMIVNDHQNANDKLKGIASSKNITLPANISNDKQNDLEDLRKKTGRDFDKAYVERMIKDHEHDTNEFESAVNNVKDPELNQFAAETLPTLRKHLEHCRMVKDKL